LPSSPTDLIGVEINDGVLARPVDFMDSVINRRLLPGDGEFDIAGFMRAVWDAGYDGPVGVEVMNEYCRHWDIRTMAEVSFSKTNAVLEAARTRLPDRSAARTGRRDTNKQERHMTLLDRFSLAGKSALVTGGASGLGLAYVEAVAEGGGAVTIADLDEVSAEREASRLTALGYAVRHTRIDVSNDDDLRRAFDEHEAAFGRSTSSSPTPDWRWATGISASTGNDPGRDRSIPTLSTTGGPRWRSISMACSSRSGMRSG
jgi:hypothetical protein